MENLSCIPKFEKQAIVNVWVGQTLKLMLLNKNFIPNAGTQQYVSDVVSSEIIDSEDVYTAGGITLEEKAATANPANTNNYFLDAADTIIGPGTTISYKYGIIYEDKGTGNHSINPIRAHIDFLAEQRINYGMSKIVWNALGIIYVS